MLSAIQSREAARVIKAGLTNAFKDLRRDGYFCRQSFLCCMSCGIAEAEKHSDKLVFYHVQAADHLRETGQVYLNWRGDGAEIMEAIEKHGLDAEWDGDPKHTILVRLA